MRCRCRLVFWFWRPVSQIDLVGVVGLAAVVAAVVAADLYRLETGWLVPDCFVDLVGAAGWGDHRLAAPIRG